MNRNIIATHEHCLKTIQTIAKLHKKGHEDLTIQEIAIEWFKEAYIDETKEVLEDIVWKCLKRITKAKPEEYDSIVFGLTDEKDGRRLIYWNILQRSEASILKYTKSISKKDKDLNGRKNSKHNQILYAKDKGLLSVEQANLLLEKSA